METSENSVYTDDYDDGFNAFFEEIKKNPQYDLERIKKAYDLARDAHKNQRRRSCEPYIMHPVAVAKILFKLGMDNECIIGALLHDVVEDTEYDLDYIRREFGDEVALLVDGVTKLTKIPLSTREDVQAENIRKMFIAMNEDVRVIIIKLCDRLHNMRTLQHMPPYKQREKSLEVLEIYAPIAHRLGIRPIKEELEDLAIYYLDIIAYKEIEKNLSMKKEQGEKFLADITKQISDKITPVMKNVQITSSVKSVHGIFRKVYIKCKDFEQIFDIYAVRIIVDTVADCYAVLGMVHDLYTPVPMRFKDYIAMPKPNMYLSLHTTVIGPNGTPFEIQIRTWEMHRIAENGIAAHWKYKEGISGKTDMDSKLEWVRQLLDTQTNIIDTDDFFNTLKFDLFEEEVFVFTPQGKVISLPAKSTVIDFAFAIHSEVGYKMSGAKVNGKIVPNNYMVQNGEIVEILTANTHGPSRDWLKICRTSQAKNKINQWFKRERRDENIEHGKELIERELRRIGNTHEQLFKQEWIAILLRRYGFQSIDDLYASVGYGGLTAQKVVFRLRDEWTKLNKNLEAKKNLEAVYNEESKTVQAEPAKRHASSKGIVVKDIDNCLVRLARCCNPVAGDDIVGFITKGRGVSVHRRDCPNMNPQSMSEEDKGRFIDVWWDDERSTSYIANLQVEAPDRDGVLLEITNILSALKIPFKSVNAYVNKKGIAIIQIGVEIRNTSDLALLKKKIVQIQGVTSVTRLQN